MCRQIHFIGGSGVGIGALAKFALGTGARVSASDRTDSDLLRALEAAGARVWVGEKPREMGDVDLVVYSSAVKADNAELAAACERGIPTLERHKFLGEVSRRFAYCAAIAGTHGKTTTTAMLTHILSSEGVKLAAMIGGMSRDFGNYFCNFDLRDGDGIFVTEACEYRRSFLSLAPTVGVVTNMECDHPDCYASLDDVKDAFARFLAGAKKKIIPSGLGRLLGIDAPARENCILRVDGGRVESMDVEIVGENRCRLEQDGRALCDIELKEDGDYNLFNAAFAVAAAMELGADPVRAARSLSTFGGVDRRYEYAGEMGGVPVYFDFAHHPTELTCVLRRAAKRGKVLTVFQPHTYSRTKAYLDDFVKALTEKEVGTLILMPAYSAREDASEGVDSNALAEAIRRAGKEDVLCLGADEVLPAVRKRTVSHGVILFVGAGDIYKLKREIPHTGVHF